MPEKKGLFDRLIREPLREVSSLTWKLSTFGAIISVALGKAYIGLKLAMLATAAAIIEQQAKKSPQAA